MDQYGIPTVKIVVVGDGAVGKTTLVLTYVDDVFPGEYIPYVAEKITKERYIDGSAVYLEIWDTPAQDDYDRLRPISYAKTDVFFLCFSIAQPVSLESINIKWSAEVRLHAPETPIFLIGTKLDLKDDETVVEDLKSRGLSIVTTERALETKENIGAARYIECSSLTRHNLHYIYDEALRLTQATRKRNDRKCVCM